MARHEKPGQHQPLQCQYPAGCTNERTLKPNGERHWLCKSHRDRQNALQRARYQRNSRVKKQKVASGSTGATRGTGKRNASRKSRNDGRDHARKGASTCQLHAVGEVDSRRDDDDGSHHASLSPSESTEKTPSGPTPQQDLPPVQISSETPTEDQERDALPSATPPSCQPDLTTYFPPQNQTPAFAIPALTTGAHPLVVILVQSVPAPCICGRESAGSAQEIFTGNPVGHHTVPRYDAQVCPVVLQLPHPLPAAPSAQGIAIPPSYPSASPSTTSSTSAVGQEESTTAGVGTFPARAPECPLGSHAMPPGVSGMVISTTEAYGGSSSPYLI